MAIASALVAGTKNRLGRGFYVEVTLTASGNYVTDGEVPSPALSTYHPTGKTPSFVNIMSRGGHVYKWDNAAQKFMVFIATSTSGNSGLSQHSAAAYNAGVTGDVITLQVWYNKTI
jgi:hypothetical protein